MLEEVGAPFPSVGAVQDALTGEIALGRPTGKDALLSISTRRMLRIPGMANGQPVAVSHVSGRGDGVVIHVETPVSRRQLDSISPQGTEGDSGSELTDFLANVSYGTGSWPESDAVIPTRTTRNESRLQASVRAFEQAASPPGNPEAATEHAVDTLGLLIDALETARGDLPRIAEVLVRIPKNPR
ncbi:MAG: hypothetical protein QM784_21705 [Polyangiaceae bacterium]